MLFLLRRPSTAVGREVLCLSTSAPARPLTEVSQAWRDGDGAMGGDHVHSFVTGEAQENPSCLPQPLC